MSILDRGRDVLVPAYPNLTEAARIIGISPSTLSRDRDARPIEAGRRDKVFTASHVLDRASVYKRRSLNEVAQDLIDHAAKHSPASAAAVEEEVEAFFARRPLPEDDSARFLADLERVLPPELFKTMKAIYNATEGRESGDIVSNISSEEEEEGL